MTNLDAQLRDKSVDIDELRKAGKMPAVFYGKKTEKQIIDQIIREQLNLINSKIQSLMRLLSGFIK